MSQNDHEVRAGQRDSESNPWSLITSFLILVPALLLFFIPFALRPLIYSGDEPDYLINANTILKLKTFNLRPTYERMTRGENFAGKRFVGVALAHGTQLVDANSFPRKTLPSWNEYAGNTPVTAPLPNPPVNYLEYSSRAVGWPLIIAGVSYMTGADAEIISKILSHLAALITGGFVFLILRNSKCSHEISLFAAVTLCLGSSYLLFANMAMAEAVLGTCVAGSLYALFVKRPFLLGLLLGIGIWVKFQFLLPSFVIFGLAIIFFNRRELLLASIPYIVLGFALMAFNFFSYGQIRPPMAWISGNPIKAFTYFFLDPQTSILLRNPWIFALLGMIAISHKLLNRNLLLTLGAVICTLILPPLMWGDYQGGYGFPCRLIQPTLIVVVILFGLMLQRSGSALRAISMLLVTLSILINLIAAISNPQLTWTPTWIWMQAFWRHLS